MHMTATVSGLFTRGLVAEWEEGMEKHALFETHALVHKDAVYTACLYLTRRQEEAEELFQETYLRAFRSFHQFTPGTNCRAWLMTIMHNAYKNRYRERARARRTVEFAEAAREYEKKLFADGKAGRDDPAAALMAQLLDTEIAEALSSLPEEYRSALLLIDLEELTYEEAATILGCPIGTIRSRLSRARRLMRTALMTYAQERRYTPDPRSAETEKPRDAGTGKP